MFRVDVSRVVASRASLARANSASSIVERGRRASGPNRRHRRAPRADANASAESTTRRPKNLVVIGGRGSGKSSVCRRIAASDKRFKLLALDDLISYEASASIPDIVAERGWRGFRELEYEVCVKSSNAFAKEWTLIDAGGGVVTDVDEDGEETYSERKVAALKANGGIIVFLDREIEYLVGRVEGDSNRPDLSASKSFREVMERRLPWYRRAADFVVDGGGSERGGERPLVKKKRLASAIAAIFYDEAGEEPLPGQWFQLDVEKAMERRRAER